MGERKIGGYVVRCGVVVVLGVVTALAGVGGAGATATHIGVLPDINVGSATNYGTGCSYTIQAIVDDAVAAVYIFDNGVLLRALRPSGGTALLNWVPATTGVHTLSVAQAPDTGATASIDVRVGTGHHIGYGCVVTG
ncbi:hypothetical protein ACFVMC_25955 [Nocardia sp. NPDC127579]|uniref:hypothetical protein n=1 Tax=Nocardia sp. NPDC127579 TaxID=3345402 RepID=UPI00362B103A